MRSKRAWRLMLAGLLAGGCANPYVRMPSIWAPPTEQQRREFSRHNPYPDSTLGPSTGARPRENAVQRNDPVRIRETVGAPSTGFEYPSTISP